MVALNYSLDETNTLNVRLNGDYILYKNDAEKNALYGIARSRSVERIKCNTEELGKWDSSLLVIVFELMKISRERQIEFDLNTLPDGIKRLLNLSFSVDRKPPKNAAEKIDFLEKFGNFILNLYSSFMLGLNFFNRSMRSVFRFFTGKATVRGVDFLFAIENCGYKALPIVSLISFMVGLILAFVGAIQLKLFGAQIYVASLVAISMVRIMGPAMAGIIMAGRTGASYAATIGTMQVNQELDALQTMGIPVIDFLTLPRILALTIMMPILSMFADIMGIVGGASVGTTMLGIPFEEYYKMSIKSLDLKNFLVGIFHGYVYGWVISLCGCFYGVYCGRDADSVGKATTKAVVASIVWIVITTGIITFVCQMFGI